MQLSGYFIAAMRSVETKEVTADEAIVKLLQQWQETDSYLHYMFRKIEGAVR